MLIFYALSIIVNDVKMTELSLNDSSSSDESDDSSEDQIVELRFLDILTKHFDLVDHLYEKFPTNVFYEVPDVDLQMSFIESSNLFVVCAPRRRQKEILKYIKGLEVVQYQSTCLKLKTKEKNDVYGLFDVTDYRRFMDVLYDIGDDDIYFYEMDDCRVSKGCLSCGDISDMICVRTSSEEKLGKIEKELMKIDNKSNGLVFVLQLN